MERLHGGNLAEVWRDGSTVRKHYRNPALAAAENAGLAWLAGFDGPPVPALRPAVPPAEGPGPRAAGAAHQVALAFVAEGAPTSAGAAEFGAALGRLHRNAAGHGFGWAPGEGVSYVGTVAVPVGEHTHVGTYLRARLDATLAAVPGAEDTFAHLTADRLDELVPAAAAAPVHGDLWSGNILWDRDGCGWLIDPAAHAGHPELDVAMLALFGAPQLGALLDAWAAAYDPAPGWRDRLPLHQLPHLLFHAAAFGGGYLDRAAAIAARF